MLKAEIIVNDGTGRNSKRQCVLPVVLTDALYRINPKCYNDL